MNYFKRTTYNLLSDSLVRSYFKKNKQKKLHVGCGENILEGWLNTDLTFTRKKIVFLDAGRKFKFKDGSFQYVFSEHIIEHLKFDEAVNMLTECYRVLIPGGTLRIATPGLDFLIKLYNEPDKQIHRDYIEWSSTKFMPHVSSKISAPNSRKVFVFNNFFKEWGHQIIYDFSTLKNLLELSGFKTIEQYDSGKSGIQELCNLEHHGTVIPEKYNLLETIVIEAKK